MRARRLLLPVLSCAALLAPAVAARAETIAFSPCPSRAGFECGTLNVPLDRSGAVPGPGRARRHARRRQLEPASTRRC